MGRLLQSPRDEPRICRDLQRLLAAAPHLADTVETLCLSRQEIAAKWRDGAAEASRAGTWMHFLFEAHVNGHAVRLPAVELTMLRTFLSELPPGSVALRSEWVIGAPLENLAGSVDLVISLSDGSVMLVDWKRSAGLPSKYTSPRGMRPPLQHLPDCAGWHYRVQLNLYRYILQTYYSLRVSRMAVVCCHPEHSPRAFVDEVPVLEQETQAIMRVWRERQAPHGHSCTMDVRAGAQARSTGVPLETPQDGLSKREWERLQDAGCRSDFLGGSLPPSESASVPLASLQVTARPCRWGRAHARAAARSLLRILHEDAVVRSLCFVADLRCMQQTYACCRQLQRHVAHPGTWQGLIVRGHTVRPDLTDRCIAVLRSLLPRTRSVQLPSESAWWTTQLAPQTAFASAYSQQHDFWQDGLVHFAADDLQFQSACLCMLDTSRIDSLCVGVSTHRELDAAQQSLDFVLSGLSTDHVTVGYTVWDVDEYHLTSFPRRVFSRENWHDIRLRWNSRQLSLQMDGTVVGTIEVPDDDDSLFDWGHVYGCWQGQRCNVAVHGRYAPLPAESLALLRPPAVPEEDVRGGADAHAVTAARLSGAQDSLDQEAVEEGRRLHVIALALQRHRLLFQAHPAFLRLLPPIESIPKAHFNACLSRCNQMLAAIAAGRQAEAHGVLRVSSARPEILRSMLRPLRGIRTLPDWQMALARVVGAMSWRGASGCPWTEAALAERHAVAGFHGFLVGTDGAVSIFRPCRQDGTPFTDSFMSAADTATWFVHGPLRFAPPNRWITMLQSLPVELQRHCCQCLVRISRTRTMAGLRASVLLASWRAALARGQDLRGGARDPSDARWPDQPLDCVRHVRLFVMHRAFSPLFRCQPGVVPRAFLQNTLEPSLQPAAEIVPVIQTRFRTLLYMAIPCPPVSQEDVIYVLIQVGPRIDDSVVVPFQSRPSWPGLWAYLLNGHGIRAAANVRYQLECGSQIFTDNSTIEWLPPRSLAVLRPRSGTASLLQLTWSHRQLPWPRFPFELTYQIGHVAWKTLPQQDLCMSCFRIVGSLSCKDYLTLVKRPDSASWRPEHCALIRHGVRLQEQPHCLQIHHIPLCISVGQIECFFGALYSEGSEASSFGLLPGSSCDLPIWQQGVSGCACPQYLSDRVSQVDVQGGALDDSQKSFGEMIREELASFPSGVGLPSESSGIVRHQPVIAPGDSDALPPLEDASRAEEAVEVVMPQALALAPEDGDHPDDEDLRLPDVFEAARRRRLAPAAQSTDRAFQNMFALSLTAEGQALQSMPEVAAPTQTSTILQHSAALLRQVRDAQPDWCEDLVRLAATCLVVYRTRYQDMFVRDFVGLVWIMEGGRYLRAHGGVCYLYHEHGAFQAFAGIPPESTFARIKPFLLHLEGIFRLLPSATLRTDASLLAALSALLDQHNSLSELLQSCRDEAIVSGSARRYRRPEGEEDRQASADWPKAIADMICRIGAPLQRDLLDERRLIQFIIEWCQTPSERHPGCAFSDCCILYDVEDSRPCSFVSPSPQHNIYVRVPHPLRDAVLESARERFERFVSQTFWCNSTFFECCCAALALAKRGENIDRCFIGESPGGTGQSLYSSHLAAVYGHNHSFIDPSLWFNEDELRKQLESFAASWILTAQEKPETHKSFREDLYKKMVSADDLAGRKPYGYVTRMLRVTGWKRIETNQLMSFRGVSERNFNSILRRSLVWRPQAIFIDAEELAAYPDAGSDGIFPKDPSLRQFLESGAAIAASLRLQLGFEMEHSRSDCRKLIEAAAAEGLTERKMRKACGLSARQDTQVPAAAAHLEAAAADDHSQEAPESEPRRVTDALVSASMSLKPPVSRFSEAWWNRFGRAKTGVSDKETMWRTMIDEKLLLLILPAKVLPARQQFVPSLRCKSTLASLGDMTQSEACPSLTESYNARSLWTHLFACPSRETNVQILMRFQTLIIARLNKKKGRKANSEGQLLSFWKSDLARLEAQESAAQDLIASLEHLQHSQTPVMESPQKRLRSKASSLGLASTENPFGLKLLTQEVTYRHSLPAWVRTRQYAQGRSAQKLSRAWQVAALPDTADLDISNCCFTLLLQLADRLEPLHPVWPSVRETLRACAEDRATIISERLRTAPDVGKELLIRTLNGGGIAPRFSDNLFLKDVQRASVFLRWLASTCLGDLRQHLVDAGTKDYPETSCLFYLWTAVEDMVLRAWLHYLQTLRPKHLSLHFDGVRVDKSLLVPNAEAFCAECSKQIASACGYVVHIRLKEHLTMLEIMHKHDATEGVRQSSVLAADGNCIPAALHALGFREEAALVVDSPDSEQQAYFMRRGHRTYEQVVQSSGLSLEPVAEEHPVLHVSKADSILVHCTKDHRPHCVGLLCSPDDEHQFTVHDAGVAINISRTDFLQAWHSSIDRKELVMFRVHKGPLPDELPSDMQVLLQLQAYSGVSHNSSDAEAQTPLPSDVRTREDVLLQRLKADVKKSCCKRKNARTESGRCVGAITDRKELILFSAHEGAAPPALRPRLRILLESQACSGQDVQAGAPPSKIGQKLAGKAAEQPPSSDSCSDPEETRPGQDAEVVTAGDILLKSLGAEVQRFLRKERHVPSESGEYRCPFCPRRSFDRATRLVTHVRTYHSRSKQHVASGTKQLKVIIALHDNDQLLEKDCTAAYLARSATMLEDQLGVCLSAKKHRIDRDIRLVLTGRGPEFWHMEQIQSASVRRVRNVYYTHEFANLLFQQTLISNGKAGRLSTFADD